MCQYVKILEPIDYYAVKFVHDHLVQRLSLSATYLSRSEQRIAKHCFKSVPSGIGANPPSLPPSKMDRSLGERVDNFHM